jgi:hypothetical protein
VKYQRRGRTRASRPWNAWSDARGSVARERGFELLFVVDVGVVAAADLDLADPAAFEGEERCVSLADGAAVSRPTESPSPQSAKCPDRVRSGPSVTTFSST